MHHFSVTLRDPSTPLCSAQDDQLVLRRFNGLTPHYACLSLWNNLRFTIPRKRQDCVGRAALLQLQFVWPFLPPSLQSSAGVIISLDGDLAVNGEPASWKSYTNAGSKLRSGG